MSDRSAIARHEASFFELVEWSEQLRPVTSVRLGAVRRRVQIRLCTEHATGVRKTCMEFVSPLGSVLNIDCLHEIPTSSGVLSLISESSLLLSFLLRVAMFVGSHRGVTA